MDRKNDYKRVKLILISGRKNSNKYFLCKLLKHINAVKLNLPIRIIRLFKTYRFTKKLFVSIESIHKKNITKNYGRDFFRITEDVCGHEFLKSVFSDASKPLICVYIRDKSFLQEIDPKRNWDYHNYRDSEASEYINLVKLLIELGFNVIRMGRISNQNINIENPNFYDYPFSKLKSDFLDIWIPHQAVAIISTGTGIDTLALLFCKPLLFINFLPIFSGFFNHKFLVAPKLIFHKGLKPNLNENLLNVRDKTDDYLKDNLIIKNLSIRLHKPLLQEFLNYINHNFPKRSNKQANALEKIKLVRKELLNTTVVNSSANLSQVWLNQFD